MSLIASVGAAGSGGGTDATTAAIDTSGATLLVAVLANVFGQAGISDSKSNTWTYVNPMTDGGNRFQRFAYCLSPTVGSGHTFSTTSGSYPAIAVVAFDGTFTYDQVSAGTYVGVTTASPGSITPGAANNLMIAALGCSAYSPQTIDSGYTVAVDQTKVPFGSESVALAYLIQSSATAQNPTWTVSSNDYSIAAGAICFTGSSGGGGGGGNPWYAFAQM